MSIFFLRVQGSPLISSYLTLVVIFDCLTILCTNPFLGDEKNELVKEPLPELTHPSFRADLDTGTSGGALYHRDIGTGRHSQCQRAWIIQHVYRIRAVGVRFSCSAPEYLSDLRNASM